MIFLLNLIEALGFYWQVREVVNLGEFQVDDVLAKFIAEEQITIR